MVNRKLKWAVVTAVVALSVIKSGLSTAALSILVAVAGGFVLLLPFWVTAFCIGTYCNKSISKTWEELKPSVLLRECFFNVEV